MSLVIAQKYYNVARAICRTCTAENVSVRSVVLTIGQEDHAALCAMASEYPSIQLIDGELSIFAVKIVST